MNRDFDIITAFDICADLMLTGDATPCFGQVEKFMDGYFLEMGGSACIFACQCAKLGLKTSGVGMVGRDAFGDIVMKRLAGAGVDTSLIETDPAAQTGLGVALCKRNGDRAILTVSGTIDWADPEVLLRNLPCARHLHIASFYLMQGMRNHWPDIVREAKRLGMTVSLDTNWDPHEKWDGIDELLPYLDIFFLNDNELLAISCKEEPEVAALELVRKVPLVVAKLGEHGALAASGGGIAHCPAMKVEVADTVGAGDTFDAGFLYSYLQGMPLEKCLKLGVYCAGSSVQARGGVAGQPTLAGLPVEYQLETVIGE